MVVNWNVSESTVLDKLNIEVKINIVFAYFNAFIRSFAFSTYIMYDILL